MILQQVTEDRTHMLQRNAENLSILESQPESQVHSLSPNSITRLVQMLRIAGVVL